MPFSKFDPHQEPDKDRLRGADPQAHRRAMLLKWGTIISQGMLYLGFTVMAYFLFWK